jgi:hypothetical protein
VLEICKQNEAVAKAQLKAKMEGQLLDPTLVIFPLPWMHKHDLRFVDVDMKARSD